MMSKVYLLSSSIIAVIVDMLLTLWAKTGSNWKLVLALILLPISAYMWAISMKLGEEASVAITLYSLFTILGCTWLGYYLNEPMNLSKMIGIVLAIVAIVLINK